MGTLCAAAVDVDAERVECGVNNLVSIPAWTITSRVHLLSVSLEAGLCGGLHVRKSSHKSVKMSFPLYQSRPMWRKPRI